MLGASIFSMFFLLTLYMQQVLGYSPLKTGIGYLLVSSVIVVSAGASQAIVTRIGVRTGAGDRDGAHGPRPPVLQPDLGRTAPTSSTSRPDSS